ncbi:AtzG-like protein [Azospirillum sp. B510]|uniref:AtzG-like protein n=1 Tax=Azospirillum sp. (strain B510) TaxID=137722 RepID=UPI0003136E8E|nr:AtzG-like protein [Azospirillum sp. B510]
MTDPEFDPLRHMETMAPACGLVIADAHKPGVAAFLTLARGMAAALMAAPLADDALDPAPVFRPGPAASGDA